MTLQNRVTPFGEIVADPARGTLMGNRGCLHDDHRQLMNRRWTMRAWVTCWLSFRGRHRQVMKPGRYTELFFLDEPTALAAGHRPCGECRREHFKQFLDAWRIGNSMADAALKDIDLLLHAHRTATRPPRQIRHRAALRNLPDCAMIAAPWDERLACLVWGDALLQWSAAGYGKPHRRGHGEVTVLTPAGTVAALHTGYSPLVHPSAAAFASVVPLSATRSS